MRPDPYKRARSRQYQAKHGMLPPRKSKEAQRLSKLPANITQEQLEQLTLAQEPEGEDTLDFDSFDEVVAATASATVDNEASKLKNDLKGFTLPAGVIDYLMEGKTSFIASDEDVQRELIKHVPSELKELFASIPEGDWVVKFDKQGPTSTAASSVSSTPAVIQLKSEKPVTTTIAATATATAKVSSNNNPCNAKNVRANKLELEDWLDELL